MGSPYPPTGTVDLTNVKWPVLFPTDAQGDAGVDEMAANNEALIDAEFGRVSAWSKTTGIPVYVGEFGADSSRDLHPRCLHWICRRRVGEVWLWLGELEFHLHVCRLEWQRRLVSANR